MVKAAVSLPKLNLNPEQQAAAHSQQLQLAIIAGPGTGKTLTLAARVAFLLESGTPTRQICAITFTHKAATELQERVAKKLINQNQKLPFIGTFHSLAYQELQRLKPQLRLISGSQQDRMLKEIFSTTTIKPAPNLKDFKLLLSQAQNLSKSRSDLPNDIQLLVNVYQDRLKQENLVDFDGLLINWKQTLEEGTATTFSHLLIDEFQDTNQLQLEIIAKLLAPGGGLSVIGDPRQAIYGFRGASSQGFKWLQDRFEQLQIVSLKTNYRSAPTIIGTAQRLFPADELLQPHSSIAGRVRLIETLDEYTESDLITREIEKLVGGTDLLQSGLTSPTISSPDITFADIAVVYRSKGLCQQLLRSLAAKGIPYQLVGEESLLAQPKCLLTIVGLYVGLGGDLKQLLTLQPELAEQIDPATVEALLKTIETESLADQPQPSTLAQILAQRSGWEQTIEKNPLLKKNWQQWFSSLIRFAGPTSTAECRDYLTQYLTQQGVEPAADKVTLLTMHAAKGLEFDQVFVLACEDGSIPHRKASDRDEEERLFYVALTRAKRYLTLTLTKKRGGQPVRPSPFLTKIHHPTEPDEALPKILKKRAQYLAKKNQLQLF